MWPAFKSHLINSQQSTTFANDMNIHDLAALVEVIDRGGLSPAAEALGVTTSAVSRRISGLEDELGAQLLLRTTRSSEPTEVGRRVLEHARGVLEAVQLARDAAREEQAEVRGLVRVVSLMAFGRLHVAPLLAEVRRRHPGIELDLIFDDRQGRVLERDFDLALVAGMPRSDRFFVTRVGELGSVVCAAPAYLAARGAPCHPSELGAHDCVLYSYSGSPDTWVLSRDGQAVEVRVSGSLRANNGEVVADLVHRGLGIGRLPEFIAGPLLDAGELVNLFPAFEMVTVPLFIATQQSQPLPRRIRAVHDVLVEGLRRVPWATRRATAPAT